LHGEAAWSAGSETKVFFGVLANKLPCPLPQSAYHGQNVIPAV